MSMRSLFFLPLFLWCIFLAPAWAGNCTDSPPGQMNCDLGVVVGNQNVAATPRENDYAGFLNATQFPAPTLTPGMWDIIDDHAGPIPGIEDLVVRILSIDGLRFIKIPLQKLFIALTGVYPMQWYGATCNGTVDDSSAITTTIAAMGSKGGSVLLCAPTKFGNLNIANGTKAVILKWPDNNGDITLTGPIIWRGGSACGVIGNASGYGTGSTFIWNGPSDPVNGFGAFIVETGEQCIFRNFSINVPFNTPLQSGIVFANARGVTGALAPRFSVVRDVWMYANRDEILHGIRIVGSICVGGSHANERCTADAAGDTFCDSGAVPGDCSTGVDNSEYFFENFTTSNARGPAISVESAESYGVNTVNINAGSANKSVSNRSTLCSYSSGNGACVIGDSDKIGQFCLSNLDCVSNDTVPLVCDGGADNPGATCTTNAFVCLVGGVATPTHCGAYCATASSPTGSLQVLGGLASGASAYVMCAGAQGQPMTLENIDSESASAAWYSGGPTSARGTARLSGWRWQGNLGAPARTCRNGTNDGTACTADAQCTGGNAAFCGGCITTRRIAIGTSQCVGGAEPANTLCHAGTECTSGGTCTPWTAVRPCCTGDGTGPECLRVINFKSSGQILVDGGQFGGDSGDGTATRPPFIFAIDTSGPTTGHVQNIEFNTSATSPFTVGNPTTQFWTWDGVSTDPIGTWATIDNFDHIIRSRNFTLYSPLATDAPLIWKQPVAANVVAAHCLAVEGTIADTSATLTIQKCDASGSSCTTLANSTVCGETDTTPVVSGGAITAGQWIKATFSAVSTPPPDFISYTLDIQ